MKRMISVFAVAAVSAMTLRADVGNVVTGWDASTRTVRVTYTLTGSGIVTVKFKKGGEYLDEKLYANAVGDVNKLVRATVNDERREIRWALDEAMPNTTVDETIAAELTEWPTTNPPDYAVFDLEVLTNSAPYAGVRFYTSTNALPGGIGDIRYRKNLLAMRKIPAKNVVWRMGSPDDEVGRSNTEGIETRHWVKLTENYYMAVFETTYGQSAYMFPNTNYSNKRVDNSGEEDPCLAQGNIPYYYLRKPEISGPTAKANPESYLIIGKMQERTGVKFDLPTEAQWEFAARGGCRSAFYSDYELVDSYWGKMNPSQVRALGWIYYGTGNDENGNTYGPRRVGQKRPNDFGLYDTVGNVAELCFDPYEAYSVEADDGISVDPIGGTYASGAPKRVLRGGYYNKEASVCRSASRSNEGTAGAYLGYGFRLVCPADMYGSADTPLVSWDDHYNDLGNFRGQTEVTSGGYWDTTGHSQVLVDVHTDATGVDDLDTHEDSWAVWSGMIDIIIRNFGFVLTVE